MPTLHEFLLQFVMLKFLGVMLINTHLTFYYAMVGLVKPSLGTKSKYLNLVCWYATFSSLFILVFATYDDAVLFTHL